MKSHLLILLAAALCLISTRPTSAAISSAQPKGEIVVTSALFGSGTNVADVTQRVSELLRTEPNGFSARGDWLRADPRPYKAKALVIRYVFKGKNYLYIIVSPEKVSYELLVENAER